MWTRARSMRLALAALLALSLLAPSLTAHAGAIIKELRLGGSADAQRIVVEFNAPVTYKYFSLANPNRLVLDLYDVDSGSEPLKDLAGKIGADDVHLSGLRVANNRPGVTRLVADLKAAMRPLVTAYPASGEIGPRLVVDLVPGTNAASPLPQAEGAIPAAATVKTPTPSDAAPTAVPAVSNGMVRSSTTDAATGTQSVTTPRPGKPEPTQAKTQEQPRDAAPTTKAETGAAPDRNAKSAAPPAREPAAKPAVASAAPGDDAKRADIAPEKAKASSTKPSADVVAHQGKETPALGPDKAGSLEKQVEQAIRKSGKPTKAAKTTESGYKRLVTIAVDPGHGGVDPGASGANGSKEKDITLAVAKRLKAHIDAQEGMRAVLTRDTDIFIPLHERVNKARRSQADLFVSIHADAFLKSTAKGSSVFALSEKGATSAAARWLAKRENEADLVGGINIDVKDVYLKQTLIDLSQTATIADSIKLGRAVLDELAEINELHRGKVEQAGFAVLKAPDIPSILVETAFISNPDEEKRLLDEEYQDRMAEAIVAGIKAYFDANPPLSRSKVAQSF
jgi:N-acetylmuramoyl-L-alanine amidase